MLVRPAVPGDAEAIRAIYNAAVGGSATFDISPRSMEDQRRWLVAHSGVHPAVVAVQGDEATGFGSLSRYRDRAAYATTVEDSVYVRADRQGQGTGRAVLDELLRLGSAHGFHAVMARIAGGNEASIALHRTCGFEVVGVEREVGRKQGHWLDVVIMELIV